MEQQVEYNGQLLTVKRGALGEWIDIRDEDGEFVDLDTSELKELEDKLNSMSERYVHRVTNEGKHAIERIPKTN